MIDALGKVLIQNGFLPHGYCLNWSPTLVGTYIISDTLIVLSYFSMPVALVYFARLHDSSLTSESDGRLLSFISPTP